MIILNLHEYNSYILQRLKTFTRIYLSPKKKRKKKYKRFISSVHFTMRLKSLFLTTCHQHMTHTTNQTPVQYYSHFPTCFATCVTTSSVYPNFLRQHSSLVLRLLRPAFAHTSPGKWLFVVN